MKGCKWYYLFRHKWRRSSETRFLRMFSVNDNTWEEEETCKRCGKKRIIQQINHGFLSHTIREIPEFTLPEECPDPLYKMHKKSVQYRKLLRILDPERSAILDKLEKDLDSFI